MSSSPSPVSTRSPTPDLGIQDHFLYKPPVPISPRFPSSLKLDFAVQNNSDDEETGSSGPEDSTLTSIPSKTGKALSISTNTDTTGNGTNTANTVLGDPLSFSPSSISPSKVSFDRITQLPTPVLGSGSFSYNYHFFPSPKESVFEGINVAKRSPRNMGIDSTDDAAPVNTSSDYSPPRVISEYRPIPALGRKNSLLENSATNSKKRFVSNPVQVSRSSSKSSAGSSPLTPSPPTISASSSTTSPATSNHVVHKNDVSSTDTISKTGAISKYNGHLFYSEKLGQTFSFVEDIGSGNFSTVVLAQSELDTVAIKIITVPTKYKNEISNFKSYIKRELNILYQLDHPCIIKLIDYNINLSIKKKEIESDVVIDSETEIHPEQDFEAENNDHDTEVDYKNLQHNSDQLIFLNFCAGGNLFQFLSAYNQQPKNIEYWMVIKRIVAETIVAVAYLHSRNIIHRDIKLENILLNYRYEDLLRYARHSPGPIVNITDFGLSKKLKNENHMLSTRCGSQDYIPPELLMGLKYNGKLTDSWSVGVLVYSILEDRLPFDLPPLAVLQSSGVSPAVIKRKLSKHNSAHRIAMIDWDWFKVNEHLADPEIEPEIKEVMHNLKAIVDVLLVRKDKRATVGSLLQQDEFAWIKQCIPGNFYDF